MKEFIKNLYHNRKRLITVLVLDDSKPGQDNSYTFKPVKIFISVFALMLITFFFSIVIYILTPIGGFFYSSDEKIARNQLIDISLRVGALQDSLERRDTQLKEMQGIIRTSSDTVLALNPEFNLLAGNNENSLEPLRIALEKFDAANQIGSSSLAYSAILNTSPDFPTAAPVPGILTKVFSPEENHFGLDLAAQKNQAIANLANGTVIYSNRTLEEGYVISIQHKNGYVTTYKHCQRLLRKVGDVVRKGEIIGYVGDIGTTSSGPHLHLEIWKDGVAQNPELYLIL